MPPIFGLNTLKFSLNNLLQPLNPFGEIVDSAFKIE
jgi:hypothetical protein